MFESRAQPTRQNGANARAPTTTTTVKNQIIFSSNCDAYKRNERWTGNIAYLHQMRNVFILVCFCIFIKQNILDCFFICFNFVLLLCLVQLARPVEESAVWMEIGRAHKVTKIKQRRRWETKTKQRKSSIDSINNLWLFHFFKKKRGDIPCIYTTTETCLSVWL